MKTLEIIHRNPLGSAAGFGSSFPIDRQYATEVMGFADLHVNSVAAQMYRVRTEKLFANAIASVAATLNRLCSDLVLYVNANYAFLTFPEVFCTGSSIMPHKRNPDVFEMIRAKCSRMQEVPSQLQGLVNNLQSGYHRDFQLSKEILFPAIDDLHDCLELCTEAMESVQAKEGLDDFSKYPTLMTVESIDALIMQGFSFREAYMKVSEDVKAGIYVPGERKVHTHTGSLGNLGNELIVSRFERNMKSFSKQFQPVYVQTEKAETKLT